MTDNRASFFSIFGDDGSCGGFALATARGFVPVDSNGLTVAAAVRRLARRRRY
jgi:hypothetical protein